MPPRLPLGEAGTRDFDMQGRGAAVLGAGTMGTALANAIASGNRRCRVWSTDPEVVRGINEKHRNPRHFPQRQLAPALEATTSLESAVEAADLLIITLRSDQVRDVLRQLRPCVKRQSVIFSATKGFEAESNKRMSEVIGEETPAQSIGVISGPNMTHDIIAELPTGIVAASKHKAAIGLLSDLIELPTLRVFGSCDMLGVELIGALKNVVALAAGLAAGAGLGDNFRSLLISFGLSEVNDLATAMGAASSTLTSLAGIGDLFLTTTSPHSRNHLVGVDLGKGRRLADILDHLDAINETAEGINTVRTCRELGLSHGIRMPIAECVYNVIYKGDNPKSAFQILFRSL